MLRQRCCNNCHNRCYNVATKFVTNVVVVGDRASTGELTWIRPTDGEVFDTCSDVGLIVLSTIESCNAVSPVRYCAGLYSGTSLSAG